MPEFIPQMNNTEGAESSEHRQRRSMEMVHVLLENVRQGDETSFDQLVRLYEPITERIVLEYFDKAQFPDDIKQEALTAMVEAIRNTVEYASETPGDIIEFDRGITTRINQYVRRALEKYSEKDPDVDEAHFEKIRNLMQMSRQAYEEYYQLLKSQPYSEMDAATKQRLGDLCQKAYNSLSSYSTNEKGTARTGKEENMAKPPLPIEEALKVPADFDTAEKALQEVLKSDIATVLNRLTERERRVIVLRFGLNGEESHTRKEIGDILGATAGQIQQTEIRALRRIRESGSGQYLNEYLRE